MLRLICFFANALLRYETAQFCVYVQSTCLHVALVIILSWRRPYDLTASPHSSAFISYLPVSLPPADGSVLWLVDLDEGGGANLPPGGGGRSPNPPELCGRDLSLFFDCCDRYKIRVSMCMRLKTCQVKTKEKEGSTVKLWTSGTEIPAIQQSKIMLPRYWEW